MAKAAKLRGAGWHTYVMTGDGEMQEGSNWEAIMAAAQFKLDNLTLIIDHNRFQQGAALRDTNDLAGGVKRLQSANEPTNSGTIRNGRFSRSACNTTTSSSIECSGKWASGSSYAGCRRRPRTSVRTRRTVGARRLRMLSAGWIVPFPHREGETRG